MGMWRACIAGSTSLRSDTARFWNRSKKHHWSRDETEYATDIVFRRQADLQVIDANLIRTAIQTVKPDDIATLLGKRLNGNYQDEMGNRYNVRIEGTRVRHAMGMASIKM